MTDEEMKETARELEETLFKAQELIRRLKDADGYSVSPHVSVSYQKNTKNVDFLENLTEVKTYISRRII